MFEKPVDFYLSVFFLLKSFYIFTLNLIYMTHTEDLIRLKNARIMALEQEVERLTDTNQFLLAQLEVLENGN